jgi:putative exporter of polyketide antibiotics
MTALEVIAAAFTILGVLATVLAVAFALALVLSERRIRRERNRRHGLLHGMLYAVPRDELADRRDARNGGAAA